MKRLLTLALFALACCLAAKTPLFDNGQTTWKVVIPVEATAENKFAVEEFVTAIKKVSGVEIPVVPANELQGTGNVVIGSLKDNALIRNAAGNLKLEMGNGIDDAIAVHKIAGNLYLAGNNPRSAAYAVYYFLREYLGVRWFWPGDDGEFMPEKKIFTVPEVAYNYKPPFRYRALTPGGNHGDYMIELGLFRMFTNESQQNGKLRAKTGAVRAVGAHSVGFDTRDFEKHQECFAMIEGQRRKEGVAGCWTHPKFLELMVEKHVNMIKKSKADLLVAFAADVVLRCDCPECSKIKNKSSRWYTFCSKLVKEVQKQCPDTRAATLAYQEYRAIPDIPVEGLEYVEYCLFNRCYIHAMDDPKCQMNAKVLAEIKRWQEHAPMGIYGYELDAFSPILYLPMFNQLANTARIFRDLKIVRLKSEFSARRAKKGMGRESANYQILRMCCYIFSMMMWNPDQDVNELLRDYCNYVYGAGADAMYEYHTTMAKYWDEMDIHVTYFFTAANGASTKLLNPKRIAAMKKLFAQAEKAVAAMPDEAARKRAAREVAFEKYGFERWEKIHNIAQAQSYTLNLPKCPEGTDFDTLDKLPVTSRNGKHRPTDMRMYWSDEGLHFRVINKEAKLDKVLKGRTGRDVPTWQFANIEFFLDLNDGETYRQMGVCLAGGTYDALGNDAKGWNPDWNAKVTVDEANDEWSVEVFLPFSSFGGTVPKDGTQWRMNIIRSSTGPGDETCGFPAAVYRDMGASAVIHFSETAKPGKSIVFLHPAAEKNSALYDGGISALVKQGWQARSINGLENLKKANLEGTGLIVLETYKYEIPVEVFREKILPAVQNGAVLYFLTYHGITKLPDYFRDPTYKVTFKEEAQKMRKYSYITSSSFSTTPNKFVNSYTPPGILIPASPEHWEILAKQPDNRGVDQPCIICRPCGKGLVAVAPILFGNTNLFFENIFEYNKAVKR